MMKVKESEQSDVQCHSSLSQPVLIYCIKFVVYQTTFFVFQRTASCHCIISPKIHQDSTSAPHRTSSALLPATSPSRSCHVRETFFFIEKILQKIIMIHTPVVPPLTCLSCSIRECYYHWRNNRQSSCLPDLSHYHHHHLLLLPK